MEITLRRHLQDCAETFGGLTGREASTVARLSTGDWRFFDRLADGGSFTARKYDAIMAWFSANWPDGAAWPAGVPRPAASHDPASPSSTASPSEAVQ